MKCVVIFTTVNQLKNRETIYMKANFAFEIVLVDVEMFGRLGTVETPVALRTGESLDIAVRKQMPLQFVRARKFAHAAEVISVGTFQSFGEIVDEKVPRQSVFPFEPCGTQLKKIHFHEKRFLFG